MNPYFDLSQLEPNAGHIFITLFNMSPSWHLTLADVTPNKGPCNRSNEDLRQKAAGTCYSESLRGQQSSSLDLKPWHPMTILTVQWPMRSCSSGRDCSSLALNQHHTRPYKLIVVEVKSTREILKWIYEGMVDNFVQHLI